MVPSTPYDRAFAALLKARTNVLYYGMYVGLLEGTDFWLRVAGGVLASGGVLAMNMALNSTPATVTIGCVGAFVGNIGLAARFADRIKAVGKIAPLYVPVDAELQRLVAQGDEVNVVDVEAQIEKLSKLRELELQELRYHLDWLLVSAEKRAYRAFGLEWKHE